MDLKKLESYLEQTLDDGRLSRSERQALREIFLDLDLSAEEKSAYLNRVFRVGRDAMAKLPSKEVLAWLLDLAKTLVHSQTPTGGQRAEVYFEPGDDCGKIIRELIRGAQQSICICVFTLTDNRVSDAVLDAFERKVAVRVITDDDKAQDRGSDVWRFVEAGLPVRLDNLPDHMHHKFAVYDGMTSVTGSYNWTRGAAEKNHENILVSDDPRFVKPFTVEFERLWEQFEDAS